MLKSFLVFVLFSFGSFAVAGDGGGSDGCGLGWQITKKKSFLATTTRGTTNATVPPTFGMTTGSIGCDSHSLAKRDLPAANLLAIHQEAIFIDMARGEGPALAALAQSMGCSNSEEFARFTQVSFAALSAKNDPYAIARELRSAISQNKALVGVCSI